MNTSKHGTPNRIKWAKEIKMKNLILTNDTDFYCTPMIADLQTGKRVRFEPLQIFGKGWTVAKVTGSKKTGRTVEVVEDFREINTYTMAQARVAAENHTRHVFSVLRASTDTNRIIGE